MVALDIAVAEVFEEIANRVVLRGRLLEGRNWLIKLVPVGLVVFIKSGLGIICWALLATTATVLLGEQKMLMRFQSLILIIVFILARFQSSLHHFNLTTALVGL